LIYIIGHVSSAATLNVYAHVTDDMRKSAAEKIDRGIGGSEMKSKTEKELLCGILCGQAENARFTRPKKLRKTEKSRWFQRKPAAFGGRYRT